MPSQIIAKPNSSSSSERRARRRRCRRGSASRSAARSRAITTMPMLEWIRLEMLRPTSTDDREIGSDLNRSTMPFSQVVGQARWPR